jgi:hypothetical protein
MFSPEQIQARLLEKPFVPLRVFTSSGQSYDITHPDLVLVGRRSLIVGVASNDNPAHFEDVSRVALMHITDLQDLPTKPAQGMNGAS